LQNLLPQNIPIVEIGVKPLNNTQLRELFDLFVGDEKKLQAEADAGEQRGFCETEALRSYDTFSKIACRIPVPYHEAKSILEDIARGSGIVRKIIRFATHQVGPDNDSSKWEDLIRQLLRYRGSGGIMDLNTASKEPLIDNRN